MADDKWYSLQKIIEILKNLTCIKSGDKKEITIDEKTILKIPERRILNKNYKFYIMQQEAVDFN